MLPLRAQIDTLAPSVLVLEQIRKLAPLPPPLALERLPVTPPPLALVETQLPVTPPPSALELMLQVTVPPLPSALKLMQVTVPSALVLGRIRVLAPPALAF